MDASEPFGDARLERYISGDRSSDVVRAFEQLVVDDPALAARITLLASADGVRGAAWNTATQWDALQARIRSAESSSTQSNRTTQSSPVAAATQTGTRPRAFTGRAAFVWGGLAACALLAIGLQRKQPQQLMPVAFTTALGQQRVVTLPDSSVVTLAPLSAISYGVSNGARTVELHGMANFKVVHDTQHAFVVHAGIAQATDIGTDFVVRAYENEARVDVSVVSGRVAVAAIANLVENVQLAAGDIATLENGGGVRKAHVADAAQFDAWRSGRLVFANASLREVGRELERWFDVKITFADSALADKRVDAVYTRSSLDGILGALSASLQLSVRQQAHQVVVARIRK